MGRSLLSSWRARPLAGLALSLSIPACNRPAPTVDCSAACPPPAAATPPTCPTPPAAPPAPVPSPAPATPPATPPVTPPAPTATSPAPVASPLPHDLAAPAFPLDPPEEASPLSSLFQPTLGALTVEEVSRDREFRRVQLSLSSFVVRGRSPAIKALNDLVRQAEQRDRWAEHAKGRTGEIWVTCEAGIATGQLFSFGCEILDGTLAIEDAEEGTGGVAAHPSGHGSTFAIVGDVLQPIALRDLLRPDADLAARLRELAASEDELDSNEPHLWKTGDCKVTRDGEGTSWMLGKAGLVVWGSGDDECPRLTIAYEDLAPLLLPGGVLARYFTAVRAAELAAEQEAAAAELAAAAAAEPAPPPAPAPL